MAASPGADQRGTGGGLAEEAAEQGDVLTYTLRVTNTGSVAAHNVAITDVLPAHVNLGGVSTPAPGKRVVVRQFDCRAPTAAHR
ncbi:MAG: DUF11 domain-containing protein [Anaerolineales bacterium]|nr:DUF11 domain-containing protein [Anaerolineales bacterium]